MAGGCGCSLHKARHEARQLCAWGTHLLAGLTQLGNGHPSPPSPPAPRPLPRHRPQPSWNKQPRKKGTKGVTGARQTVWWHDDACGSMTNSNGCVRYTHALASFSMEDKDELHRGDNRDSACRTSRGGGCRAAWHHVACGAAKRRAPRLVDGEEHKLGGVPKLVGEVAVGRQPLQGEVQVLASAGAWRWRAGAVPAGRQSQRAHTCACSCVRACLRVGEARG